MITVFETCCNFFFLFPQSITCISFQTFISYIFRPFEDQIVIIHCVQDTSSLTLHNSTLSNAFMFMYVIKLTLKFFFCFVFHFTQQILFWELLLRLFIQHTKRRQENPRNKITIKTEF